MKLVPRLKKKPKRRQHAGVSMMSLFKLRSSETKSLTRYTIDMGVTQSIIKDFLACRERARLQREGWEPKKRKKSFRFGTLVHDALEYYYKGIREKSLTPKNAARRIAATINTLIIKNLKSAFPTDKLDEIEQEGEIAKALLAVYVETWGEDWGRDWIGVEGTFDQQWKSPSGISYRLRGRRDAVFVSQPKKRGRPGVWLLETKTKSQINEDDLDLALSFDFQSLFYLLTLEEANPTKHPIKGCLYNILRKPTLRPFKATKKRKMEEGPREFTARVQRDILARPDHYFKRFELIFPEEVRKEFREQLGVQLGEFQAWLDGKLPTYRNPNSCMTKYRCEFLEVCASRSFVTYSRTRTPFPELEEK